jgi:hypothetical protein
MKTKVNDSIAASKHHDGSHYCIKNGPTMAANQL